MSELVGAKRELLRYIADNPECTQRKAATACAGTLNPSTIRERRRTLAYLLSVGLIRDKERRDPRFSRLVVTAKGYRMLDDCMQ